MEAVGNPLATIDDVQRRLDDQGYIAERSLATAIFLARRLERPLLVEGEPGVGKTEIARVLAEVLDTRLVRLQCYEGIDVAQAVYDWDYARQMLEIRLLEASGERDERRVRREIFGRVFLLKRPLLQALEAPDGRAPVLLIDELDRADEEFEAFLLELLSDWQITVPEIGTFRAEHPPLVIVTSNRTREIHDALKRRCLYHWIPYPSFDKELQIVRRKVTGVSEQLSQQLVTLVQELRQIDLAKAPGLAETLDWAAALLALECSSLEMQMVDRSLGALVKDQEDLERTRERLPALIARAQEGARDLGI
ncbi:MAG: AAA domain-containing protein [Luteitalea sp.]|nr:AAA domain-containing protein [Luteitalea sp.]